MSSKALPDKLAATQSTKKTEYEMICYKINGAPMAEVNNKVVKKKQNYKLRGKQQKKSVYLVTQHMGKIIYPSPGPSQDLQIYSDLILCCCTPGFYSAWMCLFSCS